jgi:hypothetical protein
MYSLVSSLNMFVNEYKYMLHPINNSQPLQNETIVSIYYVKIRPKLFCTPTVR